MIVKFAYRNNSTNNNNNNKIMRKQTCIISGLASVFPVSKLTVLWILFLRYTVNTDKNHMEVNLLTNVQL